MIHFSPLTDVRTGNLDIVKFLNVCVKLSKKIRTWSRAGEKTPDGRTAADEPEPPNGFTFYIKSSATSLVQEKVGTQLVLVSSGRDDSFSSVPVSQGSILELVLLSHLLQSVFWFVVSDAWNLRFSYQTSVLYKPFPAADPQPVRKL